jgi:hypothetical protein
MRRRELAAVSHTPNQQDASLNAVATASCIFSHSLLPSAGASVTGQGFSSKINGELTLFGCNSGL